jgi:two-component system repressor protein LuxO
MTKRLVLIVEDTPSLARLYAEYLRGEPFAILIAETGARALEILAETTPDVMLLDLQLPDMNGLDILRQLAARALPTVMLVITAHGSVGNAVEAMRCGAYDFIVKPFTAERLLVTMRNALERQKLSAIVSSLAEDYAGDRFCGFIGGSLPMLAVYRIIESAAKSRATVFITGESGTGKELCAEAVHALSPRSEGPFIAINCGAIPKELMESEIFGHVKGAFTGAVSDRDGAATRAHGGTLFLDEICEMDLGLQTKLLRFLQTGTFQRIGSGKTEAVDVRYVCATNRDPWAEVQAGRFREDLFYRLHVIPCALPPLREREGDVLLIARHFLALYAAEEGKRFQTFAPPAEAAIRGYSWPGNVRQLQNLIRNIVVLNDGLEVTPAMLPEPLGPLGDSDAPAFSKLHGRRASDNGQAPATPPVRPLWEVEKEAIEKAIAMCDGNVPKAAALLDISASTIYRKRLAWEAAAKG